MDDNAIRHIESRHGENGTHDQSMKDHKDIARISYVLSNYDRIENGKKQSYSHLDAYGKPSPTVVISKRIDGTYYIVEAVSDAKKCRNFVVSAFKETYKKATD